MLRPLLGSPVHFGRRISQFQPTYKNATVIYGNTAEGRHASDLLNQFLKDSTILPDGDGRTIDEALLPGTVFTFKSEDNYPGFEAILPNPHNIQELSKSQFISLRSLSRQEERLREGLCLATAADIRRNPPKSS